MTLISSRSHSPIHECRLNMEPLCGLHVDFAQQCALLWHKNSQWWKKLNYLAVSELQDGGAQNFHPDNYLRFLTKPCPLPATPSSRNLISTCKKPVSHFQHGGRWPKCPNCKNMHFDDFLKRARKGVFGARGATFGHSWRPHRPKGRGAGAKNHSWG